jgi:hypothetical protein
MPNAEPRLRSKGGAASHTIKFGGAADDESVGRTDCNFSVEDTLRRGVGRLRLPPSMRGNHIKIHPS